VTPDRTWWTERHCYSVQRLIAAFFASLFLSLSSLCYFDFLHFFHHNNNTLHNWEYLCPSLPSRFNTLHTVASAQKLTVKRRSLTPTVVLPFVQVDFGATQQVAFAICTSNVFSYLLVLGTFFWTSIQHSSSSNTSRSPFSLPAWAWARGINRAWGSFNLCRVIYFLFHSVGSVQQKSQSLLIIIRFHIWSTSVVGTRHHPHNGCAVTSRRRSVSCAVVFTVITSTFAIRHPPDSPFS
jgi:hypothetical protein